MSRKVVAFRAGEVKAAAWTEEVERILPMQDLLAAPAAPRHLVGLIRYRSRVLAVLDIRARLFPHEAREAQEPAEARYLLVGNFGGIPAALAVTDVDGILPAESCEEPDTTGLPPSMRGILAGTVRAGGEDRVLLDLTRFLLGEEPGIQVLVDVPA